MGKEYCIFRTETLKKGFGKTEKRSKINPEIKNRKV